MRPGRLAALPVARQHPAEVSTRTGVAGGVAFEPGVGGARAVLNVFGLLPLHDEADVS